MFASEIPRRVGWLLLVLPMFLFAPLAYSAPSAVGVYGGDSEDGTSVSFESTARGMLRKLEVAGLSAICQTQLPNEDPEPAELRSTNITRRETPTIRLRGNGRFSESFELTSPSRVDFNGATVRVSGRLRGYRGTIRIVIAMNKTFSDGTTMTCDGSVTIPVRTPRRR